MSGSSSAIERSASYRGRFAPSPTGPLHAGSLATALAGWLDARAHGGTWLIRIEDLDPPREAPGASQTIVATLAAFGLESDEPIATQSRRYGLYEAAFERLLAAGRVYGCACSRRDVQLAASAAATNPASSGWAVYPGTCRRGLGAGQTIRAWRFGVENGAIQFHDRAVGAVAQDVARDVGDFVVRRADGLWAYQLAVVVDDAEQGVTDVVRGADLLDNTARQISLQRALDLPEVRYLHVPIVTNERGEKLSKQTGAAALDAARALVELEQAAGHLGLPRIGAANVERFLATAIRAWSDRFGIAAPST